MADQTAAIPFGARAEQQPHTITLEAGSVRYDPQRQLNVMTDGTLWCHSEMAATCTNTNYDGKNDDTPDPYKLV